MWIDRFLGWDIYPVEVDGALVGAVLAHGPEVHVGVLPEYHGKWLRPWLWRAVFVERASRYGYLLTQVAKGRPDDFVRRCGFEPTYTDGDRTFYVRQCDV
jgi:GNAT superfamily N-acetyltransferase